MHDIVLYIIIFGLIILFSWIYLNKKEKIKTFSLGTKYYSYGNIDILIEKQNSKIRFIIINLSQNVLDQNIEIDNVSLELLNDENNELLAKINLKDVLGDKIFLKDDKINIDYESLKSFLKENNFEKKLFRFIIEFNKTKILKSVVLMLNKRWSLYVPDRGKYN